MMLRAVLLAAVVSLAVAVIQPPLRLGAWNIRQFGVATMNRPDVPEIIASVVSKYDLVVIQEVQDQSNASLIKLDNLLNYESDRFTYLVSEQRYANGKKIERYAVFYQPSRITVMDDITYSDDYGPSNAFTYSPYMLELEVKDGGKPFRFGMIVLHVRPDLEVQEMNNLADLSRDFMNNKTLPGILLGGDLNADCQIMLKNWPHILLLHPDFHWLTGNGINTSTYGTCRALDRWIVLGDNLWRRITDAGPYCYDNSVTPPPPFTPCMPQLNDYGELVKSVSDHYPVEVTMK